MIVDVESKAAIRAGALGGALAWIVGYLLTYAVAIGDVRSDEQFRALELVAGTSLSVEMIGLLFYNAHNVAVDAPQYGITQALEPSHNFIAAKGGSTLLLYAVPIAVLLVAGALVTPFAGDGPESTADAALAGTTIIVGYLPFVVLGSFVFAIDLDEGVMRPLLLLAIAFAGSFYPLICGAIGGVVARIASHVFGAGSFFGSDST